MAAMRTETAMFYNSLIRENRPMSQLVDANYTFLNEELARQLDRSKRTTIRSQLGQVDKIWARNPDDALRLLEDESVIPPDMRSFAWHWYYGLARRDCNRPVINL